MNSIVTVGAPVIALLAFTHCAIQPQPLPTVVLQPTIAPTSVADSTRPVKQGGSARDGCATTPAPNPPFTPPSPYSALPYAGEFWYGTEELWTMLPADGTWRALPHTDTGYGQKIFWWRRGYDWQAEPNPKLTVTARRLDAPAPSVITSEATNAFHPDFGSAMLVGVEIPMLGCWEVTGHIEGYDLSFVVWLAP